MTDPTQRFSNRVDNYIRYRPDYPDALLTFLRESLGLAPGARIADIGSGTGKLSAMLLRAGYRVIGVEPNDPMREAAEKLLAAVPGFTSVAGRAEATGLDDESVDAIVAGQAYHWFEPESAAREFRRLLAPGGPVALIWNDRQEATTPFLEGYDALLRRHSPDYERVAASYVRTETFPELFGEEGARKRIFPYEQVFDWEALLGRMLSSSYVPATGPTHDAMVRELRALFERENEGGVVSFLYDTKVFYGWPGR